MNTAPDKTLLDALGIEELEPKEQEALMLDLSSLIFKGSLLRLIESLDEPSREAFSQLMESNASDEELEAFLGQHSAVADKAVTDTVKELTDDILAVTGESQD